jgi:hypothetical protein
MEQHTTTVRVFCRAHFDGVTAHHAVTMPMHIVYSLHRYGEWIMLMIGESMLSLVVGVRLDDTLTFYVVFTCGFISAAALQVRG